MTVLRVLLGIVLGAGIAFTTLFVPLHFALNSQTASAPTTKTGQKTTPPAHGNKDNGPAHSSSATNDTVPLIVAIIGAVIGAVYSAIACGRGVYAVSPVSILGYVLDMSWSLLNTAASLLVWLPACAIAGGDFVEPDENSQRSGTFVYTENPRGGGYAATTIGTVIGGGWSSHEEMHVWQARIFGPVYLLVYLMSLLLNMVFRLFTGKTEGLSRQAYYRICFEDWAYSAGETSGGDINWGAWLLWFLLSAVYAATYIAIVIGAIAGTALVTIIAAAVLVAYSLIRAFTPTHADGQASC